MNSRSGCTTNERLSQKAKTLPNLTKWNKMCKMIKAPQSTPQTHLSYASVEQLKTISWKKKIRATVEWYCWINEHFQYLFIHWLKKRLFPSLALMNKGVMNMDEQGCYRGRDSPGFANSIAGSWGRSIPSFLKNNHTASHSNCTSLHSAILGSMACHLFYWS